MVSPGNILRALMEVFQPSRIALSTSLVLNKSPFTKLGNILHKQMKGLLEFHG